MLPERRMQTILEVFSECEFPTVSQIVQSVQRLDFDWKTTILGCYGYALGGLPGGSSRRRSPELWMLNCQFLLRIVLRKASSLGLQSSRSSIAHFYQESPWDKHRGRSSRALEAQQLISIQNSIEKSIDLGPPDLWKLHSSFSTIKVGAHTNPKALD